MSSNVIYFPGSNQRPSGKEDRPKPPQKRARPREKNEPRLRCWAFTVKGTRCKNSPLDGEMFCRVHENWDGILKPGRVLTSRAKITMSLTQDMMFLVHTSYLCIAAGIIYLMSLAVQKIATLSPLTSSMSGGISFLVSYGLWVGILLLFLRPRIAILGLLDHLFTLFYCCFLKGGFTRFFNFILIPIIIPAAITMHGKMTFWKTFGVFTVFLSIAYAIYWYRKTLKLMAITKSPASDAGL